jgi:gliding motility associated protien GldN
MRLLLKSALVPVFGLMAFCALAQPEVPVAEPTEASDFDLAAPIDDITEQTLPQSRRTLPYDHVREVDVLYKQYVWRVIDVREKMNLPFAYPGKRFFEVLHEAAAQGDIPVYGTEDDRFTTRLPSSVVSAIGSSVDTIFTLNPITYQEEPQVVINTINPEDIKRFRVKEVWWFDRETSQMRVRILGIAPLYDKKDDAGNLLYEMPLYWVYYPQTRAYLTHELVFNEANVASPMSWTDLFEARIFSSYVYKTSNVLDRRLQDYLTGTELLQEGEKIKQTLFNWDQDMWQH